MKVVACYSMKGGVGKTAAAVNLACAAASAGVRTLLIDLDPQGASSFYFRVRPSSKKWAARFFGAYEEFTKNIKASDIEGLDIIPADLGFRQFDGWLAGLAKRERHLKRLLKQLKGEYDLILLDCPPSIGYLAEAVFVAADMVLVPVVPTTLSERTFEQLLAFLDQRDYPRERIVPFFSMVEAQKSLHRATRLALTARHPDFLPVSIPFSADVEKMGEHQAPLALYGAATAAGHAFQLLWDAVADRLQLPSG